MNILMVNKFLYPNGGSENYVFKLGKQLQEMGHAVQYFGMDHKERLVGNRLDCYTLNMDFHTGKLRKFLYPFRIIYSREAKKKIIRILDDFMPDVVHLNNFNFQLTPSILYGIKRYEKKTGRKIKIVFTAHDSQLVCPNHLMQKYLSGERCQECLTGRFNGCVKYRCIHGSLAKSLLGSLEAYIYRKLKTYRMIDTVICPSYFMKRVLEKNPVLKGKLLVMHNFADIADKHYTGMFEKKDYVLYFGRYSEEKGIGTLLDVCRALPNIPFVFIGNGPLEKEVDEVPNIVNRGFLTGNALYDGICQAKFTVFPSECYENCPFAVMEALMCGTPVLGADIGGVSELIREGVDGELFESSNGKQLREKILELWQDDRKIREYTQACRRVVFDNVEQYCRKVIRIYET